jgi:hypothetical protein
MTESLKVESIAHLEKFFFVILNVVLNVSNNIRCCRCCLTTVTERHHTNLGVVSDMIINEDKRDDKISRENNTFYLVESAMRQRNFLSRF